MPLLHQTWYNIRFYADGWCKGNPGPMGATVAMEGLEHFTMQRRFYFGDGTNNTAEYLAVINALLWARELGALPAGSYVEVCTDSQLIDGHFNKRWNVNSEHLERLLEVLRDLTSELRGRSVSVSITKVKRDEIVAKVGH